MDRRMSKQEIFENFNKLTEIDRQEVFHYMDQGVYYLGKQFITTESKTQNDKPSNLKSYDQFNKGDHIIYRYEVLKQLGIGFSGSVVSAYDHKLKIKVAIKILRRGNYFDEKFFNEVQIYEYLRMFYNNNVQELGQMSDHFTFRENCFIILKLYHNDLLYELRKNGCKGFQLAKVRKLVQSILKGLKCLHDVNIIHGDLKPNNIVRIKKDSCDVSILDFGNSKFGYRKFERYKQCKFYRSPEVILRLTEGPAVDMWALGCVAYQLATGQYLFRGENEDDQLFSIIDVLGLPPKSLVEASSIVNKYFDHNFIPKCARLRIRYDPQLTKSESCPAQKVLKKKHPFTRFRKRSPAFVDFLQKCLQWDVGKRITATEAMSHKWLINKKIQRVKNTSLVANTKNPVSSHSIFPRPLRNVFRDKGKDLRKTLSLRDCNPRHLDARSRWLYIRSKYLTKIQYR